VACLKFEWDPLPRVAKHRGRHCAGEAAGAGSWSWSAWPPEQKAERQKPRAENRTEPKQSPAQHPPFAHATTTEH